MGWGSVHFMHTIYHTTLHHGATKYTQHHARFRLTLNTVKHDPTRTVHTAVSNTHHTRCMNTIHHAHHTRCMNTQTWPTRAPLPEAWSTTPHTAHCIPCAPIYTRSTSHALHYAPHSAHCTPLTVHYAAYKYTLYKVNFIVQYTYTCTSHTVGLHQTRRTAAPYLPHSPPHTMHSPLHTAHARISAQ